MTSRSQADGGLGIGGLRWKNSTLVAKWGWRFMKEENSFWSQVVRSIHGSSLFGWHTSGVVGFILRSPWINITRIRQKIESLATRWEMEGKWPFGLTLGWANPRLVSYSQDFTEFP